MEKIMAEMIPAQVHQDIEDIGKAVNTDAIITPRYGAPFKSLPMIAREIYADVLDLRTTKAEKMEVETALQTKANADDVYPKNEVYTKAEVESAVTSAVSTVAGGKKGYTTLALAQADQDSWTSNSIIEITNDGENNGTYQWNGTTLTKSDYDPLTQSKNYTNLKTEFWQVDSEITIQSFDAFSKYAVGFVGENGKMPLGIRKDGVVASDQLIANNVSAENLEANQFQMPSFEMKELDPISGFCWGVVGSNGKMPLGIANDGSVHTSKLVINTADNDKEKFKAVTQEWWIYPFHTFLDFPYPRIVSGMYSENGEIIVGEYVIGSGVTKQITIDSTPIIDDHNAPSLWIKKDRRAIAIWTQHALTNNLEMKVSDNFGDIRTLEYAERQTINVGNNVTYTQLHHIESLSDAAQDTFYLLSRVTLNAWNLIKLSIDQETGVVTMLSNQQILSATQQYYCSSVFDEENSVIRVASGYNPAASLNTVHYWEIDINSGDIKDHTGTVRANFLTPANLPISPATVPALLEQSDSSLDRRLHYVRPSPISPAIAYAEWLLADPDNAIYKVISKDGETWDVRDVANAGKRFGYTAQANYISGVSFPDPCYRDEVIVARYDNETSEGVLERAILIDGVYQKKESLRVDKNHLLRPMNPVNGGDICAYTQLYEYGTTSTFSFVSDIKLMILE